MAFLGERIETVVKTAREDGCWYSQGRPVFGDLLRCLRVCLDGYEGDGEECATRVLGGGDGDEGGWEEVYQKQYWERDGWCDCCGEIDNCSEADWWNLVDGVYDGWGRF